MHTVRTVAAFIACQAIASAAAAQELEYISNLRDGFDFSRDVLDVDATAMCSDWAAFSREYQILVLGPSPRVLSRPNVQYPAAAIEQGSEGLCVAQFDLQEDGSPAPSSVRVECTNPLFLEASENAVSELKYEPWLVSGRPTVFPSMDFQFAFCL